MTMYINTPRVNKNTKISVNIMQMCVATTISMKKVLSMRCNVSLSTLHGVVRLS